MDMEKRKLNKPQIIIGVTLSMIYILSAIILLFLGDFKRESALGNVITILAFPVVAFWFYLIYLWYKVDRDMSRLFKLIFFMVFYSVYYGFFLLRRENNIHE